MLAEENIIRLTNLQGHHYLGHVSNETRLKIQYDILSKVHRLSEQDTIGKPEANMCFCTTDLIGS